MRWFVLRLICVLVFALPIAVWNAAIAYISTDRLVALAIVLPTVLMLGEWLAEYVERDK